MSIATWIPVSIAAGSLLVSIIALWRTGRVRVLDVRTRIRKDVAGLRVTLEVLSKTIPAAVRSRQAATAAMGQFKSGSMERFSREAEEDAATIERLQIALNNIERTWLSLSYDDVEAKAVAAHDIAARACVLQEKYARASASDEMTREHLREASIARMKR
jgi:hypothetical protein